MVIQTHPLHHLGSAPLRIALLGSLLAALTQLAGCDAQAGVDYVG